MGFGLCTADGNGNCFSMTSHSRRTREFQEDDGPEALIRKENRHVLVNQALVLTILVLASVSTSYAMYFVTHKFQTNAFISAFNVTANRLKDNFLAEVHLKISTSRAMAQFVQFAVSAASGNNSILQLVVPAKTWEGIANPSVAAMHATSAVWSPLLRNDEERIIFEQFAAEQTFRIGHNPVCYACGSKDRGFTIETKNSPFEIPGYGESTCGFSETIFLTGVLPNGLCGYMIDLMVNNGPCICEDLPKDAERVTNYIKKPDSIYMVQDNENVPVPYNSSIYFPTWQTHTLGDKVAIMYDQMTEPTLSEAIHGMLNYKIADLSGIIVRDGYHYEHNAGYPGEASSVLYYPIFDANSTVIGAVNLEIMWSRFLSHSFPPQSEYIDLVIESTCGGNYTFGVDREQNKLFLAGKDSIFSEKFADRSISSDYADFSSLKTFMENQPLEGHEEGTCQYRIHVYPSNTFYEQHVNNLPFNYALISMASFAFTGLVFALYDFTVRQRQSKVMASAKRTNAIVSAMFPEVVRERLYAQAREVANMERQEESQLDHKSHDAMLEQSPIADAFPQVTIMFLDLCGFTVWGSERDAAEVFRLLETLYGSFDRMARRMDIFKIETVGDSYVAVCGLPKARSDHAVLMARFASACLREMLRVVKRLERTLGPGTGDLRARVGLHSGPVTAGVLRGEKGETKNLKRAIKFLTVNTAARMESCGFPQRIHVSKATADLLTEAGFESWVKPLEQQVTVKGKGSLQTYFVKPDDPYDSEHTASDFDFGEDIEKARETGDTELVAKIRENELQRLIEWNTTVLYSLLEAVVETRDVKPSCYDPELRLAEEKTLSRNGGTIVIDELTQIIQMPQYHRQDQRSKPNIHPAAKLQLRKYVEAIARTYCEDIPFHNFAHASHVTMSAAKLIKRIRQTNTVEYNKASEARLKSIHEATYGISSDTMLHFAVVFSVLIHDADHTGLTNAELCSMGTKSCRAYRGQSIAEQKSVDVGWAKLMGDEYKVLRSYIYTDVAEFRRFRQLVVNAVMATDIADKKLKSIRETRWDDAFSVDGSELDEATRNRRATITFEYIIQASDISHCFQHWLTYKKFNKRLFEERYLAYRRGHLEKEPSLGWYTGELGFFSGYIIPLAERLNKCGVFGASYSEFHMFALNNRSEWEQKGAEIVAEMKRECESKYAGVTFPHSTEEDDHSTHSI